MGFMIALLPLLLLSFTDFCIGLATLLTYVVRILLIIWNYCKWVERFLII